MKKIMGIALVTAFLSMVSASLMAADKAQLGKEDWERSGVTKNSGKPRTCSTCHGSDLTQAGRHIRTGKRIEPMAVSVNSQRLSDKKKVAKWFKRNCKWTWGRECTDVEKSQFIAYMKQQ